MTVSRVRSCSLGQNHSGQEAELAVDQGGSSWHGRDEREQAPTSSPVPFLDGHYSPLTTSKLLSSVPGYFLPEHNPWENIALADLHVCGSCEEKRREEKPSQPMRRQPLPRFWGSSILPWLKQSQGELNAVGQQSPLESLQELWWQSWRRSDGGRLWVGDTPLFPCPQLCVSSSSPHLNVPFVN